jgi:hypothetical protein
MPATERKTETMAFKTTRTVRGRILAEAKRQDQKASKLIHRACERAFLKKGK